LKKLNFKAKVADKRFWLIILAMVAVSSVIAYAAVQDFTLNVPSSVVVVRADPGLQLIALDKTTVVTSITFGNIVQGETGTWSGYLNNTGNVDLHTFSIASSDIGSVGTVTWNMPVSGDLSVGQMCPVTITLSINQTADLGSHTFTIQITGSPTITGPTNVTINANDSNDQYLRDWAVTFDRPMPPIIYNDNLGYVGSDDQEAHISGDTMTVRWTLSAGPHYLMFIVSQCGGSDYGTYSGTITINGQAYNFSGVDCTNPVRINFNV
jgi:hypothetical protein